MAASSSSPRPFVWLLLSLALHAGVLVARHVWVETDPETFASALRSALIVFVVLPAILVAIGVRLRRAGVATFAGVLSALLVATAVFHAVIVLAAANAELPPAG